MKKPKYIYSLCNPTGENSIRNPSFGVQNVKEVFGFYWQPKIVRDQQ